MTEQTGDAHHLWKRMLEHLRKLSCRLFPKWRHLRESSVYLDSSLQFLDVARFKMRPLDKIVEARPPAFVSCIARSRADAPT